MLTHAAQQEGRLDPSQSAQLLLLLLPLARRDVIISRQFEGRRSRIPGYRVRGGGDGEAVAGVSRLRAWGRGCGVEKRERANLRGCTEDESAKRTSLFLLQLVLGWY